ncbi:hypothetical protein Z043_121510 [Scleropages formosus]|uniref:Histamine N-methyltransferase-like n=1 Tax=Scleropages formosus TaxID=113540 RepID=A0A0P7TRY7_SCLFO|nr:hypothetical protein Z043_121510 [Scleropages formosus]
MVAKSPNLQKIQFSWNTLSSEKYEEKLKNSKETKKFDFIHMIQVLNHVTDCLETIKFFHSLLAERGKLLIIHGAVNNGFHILWKTFQQELCKKSISEYFSARDVKCHLEKLGLKYEEHIINNTLDITECFIEEDKTGEVLLDFLTDLDHFHQSLTADLRANILNVLRNKCSTEKNGRILFDSSSFMGQKEY